MNPAFEASLPFGFNGPLERVETRGREYSGKGNDSPSPSIPGPRLSNKPFPIPIRPFDIKDGSDFPGLENMKITMEIN
jgi:hypothetical protein